MKKKRIWFKEFYQRDPTDNSISFYYRQRRCEVILEEVGEYKHNIFIAEVKRINPLEPFETKGVAGGCKYRFRIGERFLLRRHKGGKNNDEPWYSTFQISIGLMYVILEEKILKSLRFILAIKTPLLQFNNNPRYFLRNKRNILDWQLFITIF